MFGCIWTHEKSRTPVPIIMSVLTRIRIQKISRHVIFNVLYNLEFSLGCSMM